MLIQNKYNIKNKELFEAVSQNKVSKVINLINSGADVNSIHNESLYKSGIYQHCTCLYKALSKGYIEIVKLLIDARADINASNYIYLNEEGDKHALYPLTLAIGGKLWCPEILKLMIKNGAKITSTDYWNPLIIACGLYSQDEEYNDALYQCCKELIKAGVNVNYSSLEGETPLFLAVTRGHLKIVHLLIKHHATINLASDLFLNKKVVISQYDNNLLVNNIAYILCKAAQFNNYDLIYQIIRRKIDLNITYKNSYLKTCPLSSANKYETIEYLLENGADPNYVMDGESHSRILCSTLYDDSLDKLRLLLKHGADANHLYSDYNQTALLIALQSHLPFQKAKILLEHDADINVLDINKQSAMHYLFRNQYYQDKSETLYASLSEILKTIDLLIESKALVELKDNKGNSPLHIAASNGYGRAILEKLISLSKNFNDKNNFGETALDLATRNNNQEGMKYIKFLGGECNIFSVFFGNNISTILIEIENASNIEVFDSDYNTLLHYAVKLNLFAVVKKLVEKKAIINKFNVYHKTPLDIALEHKHTNIVEYLKIYKAQTFKELNIDLCSYWLPNNAGTLTINYHLSDSCIFLEKYIIDVFNYISDIFLINFKKVKYTADANLCIILTDIELPTERNTLCLTDTHSKISKADIFINFSFFKTEKIKNKSNFYFSKILQIISKTLGLQERFCDEFSILKTIPNHTKKYFFSEADILCLSSRYGSNKGFLIESLSYNYNNTIDSRNYLFKIIEEKNLKKLKKEFEFTCDINIKDKDRNSLIYLATINEFISGVKLLYKKGAILDIASALILELYDKVTEISSHQEPRKNHEVFSDLFRVAVLKENLSLIKALTKYGTKVSSNILFLSIEVGNLNVIKQLVMRENNIDLREEEIENLFLIAADLDSSGRIEKTLKDALNVQKYKSLSNVIDFRTGRTIKL